MDEIRRIVADKLRPLRNSLLGMVTRGVVKQLAEGGLQRAQLTLTADEVADEVECFSPFGFASRPATAEALVFAVQGNPSHRVALLFDRTTRLQSLADGEAALYVGTDGQHVKLVADGSVEIKAQGSAASSIILKPNGDIVLVPSPSGSLLLGADGATKKVALAEDVEQVHTKLQTAFDTHVHIGVTPGPGVTGTAQPIPGVIPVGTLPAVGSDNVKAKG